ncbi:MAG TPA: iron-containing alcohol dehydrogenase [Vicinamibacteria bacterium]|nr:iron-containing alcohol dehydrogenase [Vicinamibacteria bacterium]
MEPFDFQSTSRLIFGEGALGRLGPLARDLGFRRTLVTADQGLVRCGHFESATRELAAAGIRVFGFHDFGENPNTLMIESGRDLAAREGIDSLIGLGGGSSMDCAKGINFLLTNGGTMKDYWGYGKALKPMLPMIGIPTTAGTGSEAQSYALISDADTHVKMACGDPQAAFRIALLDPRLTVSQPRNVTAVTGFDALAHAVETYVTAKRNPLSDTFSREAWRLLEGHYERVLAEPEDIEARGAMQLGAHYAGIAVESSMLGATHACANPLTTHYGTTHGIAIAVLLPHVVRWNAATAGPRYRELLSLSSQATQEGDPGESLAGRLEQLANTGGLPSRLRSLGVPERELTTLAEEAADQWTGRFNPRPFDASGALEVYQWAY